MKRVIDLFVSIVGLILLSPLLGIIAIGIRLDTPGPIFYWGTRSGKNGQVFRILKFRTMYEHPDSYDGPRITARGDLRITPIGKWLRDTKLNEFPQLWNVLTGEMSLVGPRPEDPEIVSQWPDDIRQEVLSVRPGMTSPASIQYHGEEALLSTDPQMNTYWDSILPDKLRLDQLYIRNWSLWLDLDVIFWTSVILIPLVGNYRVPERLLFLGPITRFVRRYITWFFMDLVISLLAFSIVGLLWRTIEPLNVGLNIAPLLSIGFAILFSLAGAIFGVQRISWSQAVLADIVDLVPPTIVATIMASLFANQFYKLFPLGVIWGASVLAFIGFVIARYRNRLFTDTITRLFRRGATAALERVLIVGGGETGQFAAWLLHHSRMVDTLNVIGFVDDDLYKQKVRIQGVRVLGQRGDIPELVREHDVGIIVFAIHNIPKTEQDKIKSICEETPARLVVLPDFLDAFRNI